MRRCECQQHLGGRNALAIAAGLCAVDIADKRGTLARSLWLMVAVGVQLRLLANMLDGMVAIQTSTASPVGELYNEVPDRVSDAAVFVGMGYAAGGSLEIGSRPAWQCSLPTFAACKAAGAAQDYCGPMAKLSGMFLVTVVAAFMALAPATCRSPGRDGACRPGACVDRTGMFDHVHSPPPARRTTATRRQRMTEQIRKRFVGYHEAFNEPVVVVLVLVMAAILLVARAAIFAPQRAGRLKPELKDELVRRTAAWVVMVPCVMVPVLLGRGWGILLVMLSLLCYREFARATGLFREKAMSLMVVLAFGLIGFASMDHWYGLFMALAPLVIITIAALAIAADKPTGYIQRIGLAWLKFMLFGVCLGVIWVISPMIRATAAS